MLTLEIAKIPAEGLELDSALDAHEVHVEGERTFELEPGGRFIGRADRGDEGSIHVRGHVRASLRLECGRCLEQFVLPVDQELDLFYLPERKGVAEAEEDVGLADRDMVVAYYDGEQLDVAEALREQFFLAVPLRCVCKPQCRGLCRTCGVNRNLSACACPEIIEPRLGLGLLLDVDGALKKQSGQGRH